MGKTYYWQITAYAIAKNDSFEVSSDVYSFATRSEEIWNKNNIEAATKACIVHGGEGFLLTDWGDGGHSQFIVMSFLPYIWGLLFMELQCAKHIKGFYSHTVL